MTKNVLSSSQKILQQLFLLRNITIIFIVLMMLLARYGLDLKLPLIALSIILLLMAGVNLLTFMLLKSGQDISDKTVFAQLSFEIISFSLILYFSGGATNPFTFYYLIPIAIAATVIPGKLTWLLMAATVFLYSVLLKFYVPLMSQAHHHDMGTDGQFSQHVFGMWFGFLVSAVLVTLFITRLAKELKLRDEAIAEAQQSELRNQQMVTLGTLAAGTAHELGTPLASLSIITGDLMVGLSEQEHPELFANQTIMKQQIKRCKKILSVLSDSVGQSRADAGHLIEAKDYIVHTVKQWKHNRQDAICDITLPDADLKGQILSDKTLSQAFINLLNNAADASELAISVVVSIDKRLLNIAIQDSGAGMSDEQIAMAGDVSFSTKPNGMGIGLFLAITTIRRYGGSVIFNRVQPKGTRTLIQLPLIETDNE